MEQLHQSCPACWSSFAGRQISTLLSRKELLQGRAPCKVVQGVGLRVSCVFRVAHIVVTYPWTVGVSVEVAVSE